MQTRWSRLEGLSLGFTASTRTLSDWARLFPRTRTLFDGGGNVDVLGFLSLWGSEDEDDRREEDAAGAAVRPAAVRSATVRLADAARWVRTRTHARTPVLPR